MSSPKNLAVTVGPDCGNAPKKAQVCDWLIALAEGDIGAVCSELDTHISWDAAGEQWYDGIDEVRAYLEQLTQTPEPDEGVRQSHAESV